MSQMSPEEIHRLMSAAGTPPSAPQPRSFVAPPPAVTPAAPPGPKPAAPAPMSSPSFPTASWAATGIANAQAGGHAVMRPPDSVPGAATATSGPFMSNPGSGGGSIKPSVAPPPPPAPSGGGGGGGRPAAPAAPTAQDNASSQIMKYLQGIINGEGSAFSPGVVEGMKGDLLRASEGRRAAAVDANNNDAVARGLFRSGIPGRENAMAGRAAASDYTSGVRDILKTKASADAQQKQSAIAGLQQWLDSGRQVDLENAKLGLEQQQLNRSGGGGGAPETIAIPLPNGQTANVPPWLLQTILGGDF